MRSGIPTMDRSKCVEERFWSSLDTSGECWNFTGTVSAHGYGQMSLGTFTRRMSAHRLAYLLSRGPIPEGQCVCHRCDNRRCCRPSHLFAAPHRENIRDRDVKGRQAVGEQNGKTKLSADQVKTIRQQVGLGMISQSAISRKYGVSTQCVSNIVLGNRWKYLDG